MKEMYKDWEIKYIENNPTHPFKATKDDITIASGDLTEIKKKLHSMKCHIMLNISSIKKIELYSNDQKNKEKIYYFKRPGSN